jgi:medium-chain acyl-[acyl-carrier-protein] hydrolase
MMEKEYRVGPAEAGFDGRIRPARLLDRLQNLAEEAAEALGTGLQHLYARDLAWVVVKYRLRMARYPSLGESFRVRTWHFPSRNLYSLRRFELRDGEGADLGRLDSAWLVLEMGTKRPVRLDRHLPELFRTQEPPLPDDFARIRGAERADREIPFPVGLRDLDANRHVNNRVYVELALETVPPELQEDRRLAALDAVFSGEAGYGDTILSRAEAPSGEAETEGRIFRHRLVRLRDGADLCLLESRWA